MTSQKYEQTRSCAKCGYEETRFLDELTAAFEETRAWSEPCSKCGSTDFSGGSNALPPLSSKQLEIWAINDELHFSQQDEDLILATPSNLELLLEFLDSPSTHIWQRRTLASALYILWYDAYPQTGKSYLQNAEFAEKVALEINKRTSLFVELGASKSEEFGEPLWYLSSYVREEFEKHKP
jgi:predicted nucleic-acid-binding Zn-ribbon protein